MFFLSKHPLRACVRVVTLSVAMISVDRANELSESQLDRGRAQLDLLCDCVGACMRIFCIPADLLRKSLEFRCFTVRSRGLFLYSCLL